MRKLYAVFMQNEARTMLLVEGRTEDEVRNKVLAQTSVNFDILDPVAFAKSADDLFQVNQIVLANILS